MSEKTTLVADSKERVALELMQQLLTASAQSNQSRRDDPVWIASLYDVALNLVSGYQSQGIDKMRSLLKQ